MTFGDFDADGNLDVALPVGDEQRIERFFGDGFGRFQESPLVSLSSAPLTLAAGDFDQDGFDDLVAALPESTELQVVYGRADRGVSTTTVPVGGGQNHAVVADVNLDQRDDLIVALSGTDRIAVLLGDGAGGFTRQPDLQFTLSPVRVLVTDLDDDGFPDVVGAYSTTQIATFRGNGTGTFQPIGSVTTIGGQPFWISAGQFDGNSFPDIAVSRSGPSDIEVLLNDGSGFATGPPIGGFVSPGRVRVQDLNGDGLDDLLVADRHTTGLHMLFGNGLGLFERAELIRTEGDPSDSWLVDLDKDGQRDLIFLNSPKIEIGVRLAKRPLSFTDREVFAIEGGARFGTSLDFDGDQTSDVVVSRPDANDIRLLRGDGLGAWTEHATVAVPGSPRRVVAEDLDGDGDPDLAVVCQGDGRIRVLRNDAGVFSIVAALAAVDPTDVVIGRFDGDAFLDLVASSGSGQHVRVFAGDGTTSGFAALADHSTGGTPTAMGADDLDDDQDLDLVVNDAAGNACLALLNDGTGAFGEPIASPLGEEVAVTDLAIADFDGDRVPDLAIGEGAVGQVLIARGDGAGGFQPQGAPFLIDQGAVWLDTADLDFDGDPDVVAVTEGAPPYFRSPLVVLENDHGRGFQRDGYLSTRALRFTSRPVFADSDSDGDLEVLSVASPLASIVTLRNRSLDDLACRIGNVNGGAGAVTDVLFVNDSAGAGVTRRVSLSAGERIRITMDLPPAESGTAPFVVYGFASLPSVRTTAILPKRVGVFCLDTPLDGGGSVRQIWNNIGFRSQLGVPTLPSVPAPSVLLDRDLTSRAADVFLQGIILDRGSRQGTAAVTNGVHVSIR